MTNDASQRAAERVARESYGRLLAYVAARTRDVCRAEDALADAFASALEHWPRTGVPTNPEAWMLTAARRKLVDAARRERTLVTVVESLASMQRADATIASSDFPDERLELLFVCAHPAIDASVRTPLMLQTVLGLDAATIASAFLVSPSTMSQRLVRAKTKIRDAAIRFELPERHEWPGRLEAVLSAIYAAYGAAWEEVDGADGRHRTLAEEALWLAGAVCDLCPEEPEAHGLHALLLYCESRRAARRTEDGQYVPLAEQDCALWSGDLIAQAEAQLNTAFAHGRPGRFQLEAAIQSAHAARRALGRVDYHALAELYRGLVAITPTVGAIVGYAAARGEVEGPAAALEQLDQLPADAVKAYQPYWACRAHWLAQDGQHAAAREAYSMAIGLTQHAAVRTWLEKQSSASGRR